MGSTPRRTFTSLRPLAALAPLLAALVACEDPGGTTLADEALRGIEADQVAYDMRTFVTSEGIRQARILADTAYFYNDSSITHLVGVDLTIFSEDGSEKASVVSERGRVDRRTDVLTARGDVVLRIPEQNRVIESPALNYDPGAERIWSDSATTMRQDGRVTRGSCFRSDLSFSNYTVCDIRGAAGGLPGAGSGG